MDPCCVDWARVFWFLLLKMWVGVLHLWKYCPHEWFWGLDDLPRLQEDGTLWGRSRK